MDYSDNPSYSYEEIRNAAIDILAGRTKITFNQYNHLKNGVRENLFYEKNGTYPGYYDNPLSPADGDIFLEVFWDFFRQGIITLGMNDQNPNFPFFRVSAHGKRILENQDVYFYHDVSSYEAVIKQQVPDIDDVTLIYLKEAMQSFYSGCYLSSSVMLGVASEHTFLKLLEKIETTGTYKSTFKKTFDERNISKKFEAFKNRLKQEMGNNICLPDEIKENLDTNLDGIMNTIRNFRNDSGHPSGNIISREQCYVNLNLFVPYCKKAYQLIDFF
jgi:hypothetical protein